jgi:hypothetical protein
MTDASWPPLRLHAWEPTYLTLHRFSQVLGKVCLALAPPTNHWWHATLTVTPQGLSTPALPHGGRCVALVLDLRRDELQLHCSDGRSSGFALHGMSVAGLWHRTAGADGSARHRVATEPVATGAAAALLQMPYLLNELLATVQFLLRRAKAGQNWLRGFFVGDTDERGKPDSEEGKRDEFERPPAAVMRDMVYGGVSLPCNLALAALIGLALLFTRVTRGVDGNLANAHHVIGSLVLTVVSVAAAEVARPARYSNVLLGDALVAVPFVIDAGTVAATATVLAGAALVALSFRGGPIREHHGRWDALIRRRRGS